MNIKRIRMSTSFFLFISQANTSPPTRIHPNLAKRDGSEEAVGVDAAGHGADEHVLELVEREGWKCLCIHHRLEEAIDEEVSGS